MKLFMSDTYLEADDELKQKHCNGCGPDGLLGKIVPGHLAGTDITEACNIHDWMYSEGDDKQKADLYFLANMVMICAKGSKWLFPLRVWLATKYFLAVHYGGEEYFKAAEVAA